MKMFLPFAFVAALLWYNEQGEVCENCLCEDNRMECYIEQCSDKIAERMADYITVYGSLFAEHRTQLNVYLYKIQ